MPKIKDTRTRITHLLASCYNDPSRFSDLILGRPPHFDYQKDIVNSVIKYRTTVVVSGNMIGKDWVVGGLVPYFLLTRKNSLVIITGPSQTTLGSITWKEIRRAVEGSRFPLGIRLSNGVKTSPQVASLNASGWGALGFSTTSIERFSGHHAGQLLVIVEEASGIDDDIWTAIDSLGPTRLLNIGNPIRPDGRFIKLFHQAAKDRRDKIPPEEAVNSFQLPSTVSPHIEMEHSPVGLADRTWLRSMARQHGVDSLFYRSHVLAIIPVVAADTLIKEANLDLCTTNTRAFPPYDPRAGVRIISCDLSEGVGSDSTVIFVRDHIGILDCVHGSSIGLEGAAAAIADLAKRWKVDHANIRYDCLGIGSKFGNYLARHGIHSAMPYSGAGTPMCDLYLNLRCECAFTLRARLDPGWVPDTEKPYLIQQPFVIPAMGWYEQLREELLTLSYDQTGKKIRLLPKEDHKARLGRSPDFADSFLMSWA